MNISTAVRTKQKKKKKNDESHSSQKDTIPDPERTVMITSDFTFQSEFSITRRNFAKLMVKLAKKILLAALKPMQPNIFWCGRHKIHSYQFEEPRVVIKGHRIRQAIKLTFALRRPVIHDRRMINLVRQNSSPQVIRNVQNYSFSGFL